MYMVSVRITERNAHTEERVGDAYSVNDARALDLPDAVLNAETRRV